MASPTSPTQPLRSDLSEREFRERIVACARSWCSTKYHLNACVKGAGVDCGRLPLGVLQELGLLLDEKIEVFSQDWFCHASEDAYKLRLLRHAQQIAEAIAYPTLNPKPGCILLIRAPNRRVHYHGGIATEWPFVIHAIYPAVEEVDASRHPMWMHKQVTVFDPWPKFSTRGSECSER